MLISAVSPEQIGHWEWGLSRDDWSIVRAGLRPKAPFWISSCSVLLARPPNLQPPKPIVNSVSSGSQAFRSQLST